MRRLVLVAAVAALAGCGGGDGGGGDSSPGEVTPAERGQVLVSANLKIADEHPEDGQLNSKTVKITEDDSGVVRVVGTTPDSGAKWDMTLVREGEAPYDVQVYLREE